jgi:3D (Asp-Asp-Asp) domain-containing protein
MRNSWKFLFVVLLGVAISGCGGIRPPRRASRSEAVLLTTGYCQCKECSGWHRNWLLRPVFDSGPNKGKRKKVGVTASGTKARKGTIAADTAKYPFGTVMYVPGYGYGRVEDRGGAIKGNHVDLFFKKHKRALEWGKRQKQVKIWIPKK